MVVGREGERKGGRDGGVMGKQIKAIYHICEHFQWHSPNGTGRRSSRDAGRKLGRRMEMGAYERGHWVGDEEKHLM